MIFRTALCDLIGIDYPIVQSGMGAIAGPELVAEVCRAGGLGILAGLNVPPDRLRGMIRRVRELTDRPFGVNLWLHRALRPPIDPDAIGDETLRGAQGMLNQFRQRLNIPAMTARPGRAPDVVDAAVEVVLDERPAVFSAALGWLEPALVEQCRRRGIKMLAMVSNVEDARAAAADGRSRGWRQGLVGRKSDRARSLPRLLRRAGGPRRRTGVRRRHPGRLCVHAGADPGLPAACAPPSCVSAYPAARQRPARQCRSYLPC